MHVCKENYSPFSIRLFIHCSLREVGIIVMQNRSLAGLFSSFPFVKEDTKFFFFMNEDTKFFYHCFSGFSILLF